MIVDVDIMPVLADTGKIEFVADWMRCPMTTSAHAAQTMTTRSEYREEAPAPSASGPSALVTVATLLAMLFRWDWLRPVLRAPYVPALGPVQPGALSADLFENVVSAAGTGEFLPYDKDRRWSGTKDERVIVTEVIHSPDLTVIPTRSGRDRGIIKIHHYGLRAPDLSELAAWSRELCGGTARRRGKPSGCRIAPTAREPG